jgi:hypothetical protein
MLLADFTCYLQFIDETCIYIGDYKLLRITGIGLMGAVGLLFNPLLYKVSLLGSSLTYKYINVAQDCKCLSKCLFWLIKNLIMKKILLTTICVLFALVGFAQHDNHGPEGVEAGTGDRPITVNVSKQIRKKVKPIIDAFVMIQDITDEKRNKCRDTLQTFVTEMNKIEKPLRQLADLAYVRDIQKQVKHYRISLNKINLNKKFKYYYKMN